MSFLVDLRRHNFAKLEERMTFLCGNLDQCGSNYEILCGHIFPNLGKMNPAYCFSYVGNWLFKLQISFVCLANPSNCRIVLWSEEWTPFNKEVN